MPGILVVAEPIRSRFEDGKRFHIGLFVRGIRTPGREGYRDFMTGVFGRLLDARTAAKNDQAQVAFGRFLLLYRGRVPT